MLQRDQRLHTDTDEDAYYAQYATVQPAMDNHDPDEARANGEVESTLGNDEVAEIYQRQREFSHPTIDTKHELHSSSSTWSEGHALINGSTL
jgi:hypothetical protein